MRIGIDFDNTIVSYDALFYRVAREWDVVPPETAVHKMAVRDYLRRAGREDRWTEMQGYVYGARMDEAEAYPGAINFLLWARDAGHTVSIMSHKTRHPFIGPQYDLHAAARQWIARHLVSDDTALVPKAHVFFELTKEGKLDRIGAFRCHAFIDDLPEILLADRFPATAARLLFDPEQQYLPAANDGLTVFRAWTEAAERLGMVTRN